MTPPVKNKVASASKAQSSPKPKRKRQSDAPQTSSRCSKRKRKQDTFKLTRDSTPAMQTRTNTPRREKPVGGIKENEIIDDDDSDASDDNNLITVESGGKEKKTHTSLRKPASSKPKIKPSDDNKKLNSPLNHGHAGKGKGKEKQKRVSGKRNDKGKEKAKASNQSTAKQKAVNKKIKTAADVFATESSPDLPGKPNADSETPRTKQKKALREQFNTNLQSLGIDPTMLEWRKTWSCGYFGGKKDRFKNLHRCDLFEIRQKIATFVRARNPEFLLGKDPEKKAWEFYLQKNDGHTQIDKFEILLGLGCDDLGSDYHPFGYADYKMRAFGKLYNQIIAPYEKFYHFQPITPFDHPPADSSGDSVDNTQGTSNPHTTVSLDCARKEMTTKSRNLATIIESLIDMAQDSDSDATAALKTALADVRSICEYADINKDATANHDFSSPPSVAILGNTGSGKSFTLNVLAKITEMSDAKYTIRGPRAWSNNVNPSAEHAAKVVARFLCQDLELTLEDDAQSLASIEQDCFDQINDTVLLAFAQRKERVGHAYITYHVEKHLFGEKKVPTGTERVVWELPSGLGCKGEPIFTNDGLLNVSFNNGQYTKQKVDDAETSKTFKNYAKGKTGDVGTTEEDGNNDGEFVLPCHETSAPVTSHNFFVTGGKQYALITRFISTSWLNVAIKAVKASNNSDAVKLRKERVLSILYHLRFVDKSTDPDDETYDTKKDKFFDESGSEDEMFAWWEANQNSMPTESSEILDKIYIYQGAGMHVVDDRIYLRERLRKLLINKWIQLLILEFHWVIPSSLFNYEPESMLVDTPGLNDMNVIRQLLTEDAIHQASGVLVFAEKALSGQTNMLGKLNDLGVTKEVICRWLGKKEGESTHHYEGTTSKDVIFLINSEKQKKKTAVPAPQNRIVFSPTSLG